MFRPAPKRVEKVMGKYDFDGSDPDDLPFKKGELLTVVSKVIITIIIIIIVITIIIIVVIIILILIRTRSNGGPPEIPLVRRARYLYLMLLR